jgi:hypothetical protein
MSRMRLPTLLAGAGAAEIAIPAGSFPLDGFTASRDPLLARVLLLDDGSRRIAIAVADLISLPDEPAGRLRDAVATAGGLQPGDVLLCATHTFSTPHVGPLPEAVIAQAFTGAATAASRSLRAARVGFGTGTCRVAVNRVVKTRDGWWHGADDGGVSDPGLAVIRVDDLAGQPVAVLLNYAVQSSVMHESATAGGGRLVTGDLAGAACRHLEQRYPGAVALFLIGAAGDQAPYLSANRYTVDRDGGWGRSDAGEAGYLLVELLGERLGSDALRVSERISDFDAGARVSLSTGAVTVPAQHMPARVSDIRPALSYQFQPTGTAEVPLWVASIGHIRLAGLRAELNAATGIAVKNAAPHGKTLVLTMVNGGAKYLPEDLDYDRISFQAMNSQYARGALDLVVAKFAEMLNDLKEQ